MKRKFKHLTIIAVATLVVSCGEKQDTKVIEDAKDEITESVVEVVEVEEVIDPVIEEVVESKYHYDQDWEIFKTAIINSDLQGISAYASSDAVDAQVVIDAFADPDFMAQLKAATYDDLSTNDTEFGVELVFSASVSGSDDEGNEYESGLELHFTQGELNLEFDYIMFAG